MGPGRAIPRWRAAAYHRRPWDAPHNSGACEAAQYLDATDLLSRNIGIHPIHQATRDPQRRARSAWSVARLDYLERPWPEGPRRSRLWRDRLALAVMRRDGSKSVLERCDILPLGTGAGSALEALRAAGIPRIPVSTVLGPEDYRARTGRGPEVPPAELRAAMRWRLKDSIDFRVEDAVIDVFDVPDQNRGGHGRMMYAVAARPARCTHTPRRSPRRRVSMRSTCRSSACATSPRCCPWPRQGSHSCIWARPTPASCSCAARLFIWPAMWSLLRQRQGRRRARADQRRRAWCSSCNAHWIITNGTSISRPSPASRYRPPALAPTSWRGTSAAETGFEVGTLDLNALVSCRTPIEASAQASCLLAVGAALREEHRSL